MVSNNKNKVVVSDNMNRSGLLRRHKKVRITVVIILVVVGLFGIYSFISIEADKRNFNYMANSLRPTKERLAVRLDSLEENSYCTKHMPKSFDGQRTYSCTVSYEAFVTARSQDEVNKFIEEIQAAIDENPSVVDIFSANKYPNFISDTASNAVSGMVRENSSEVSFKLNGMALNWCSSIYTLVPVGDAGSASLKFNLLCTTPTKSAYLNSVRVE